MSRLSLYPRRRRALAAACFLLPATTPVLATTYDLTGQTVSLTSTQYTASDTLKLDSTTLNGGSAARTLPAALNIINTGVSFSHSGTLTVTGPLTGDGRLGKIGAGTLVLAGDNSAFTGYADLSAGTLRLASPSALGTSLTPTRLGPNSTLDLNGFTTPNQFSFDGGTLANNNTSTPVSLDWQFLNSTTTDLRLGGGGDLTVAANYPTIDGTLYKSGTGTLTYSTPTRYNTSSPISVITGTLRLGIESPFAGSSAPGVTVTNYAVIDLNGFDSPGLPVTLNNGYLFNNNPSATSTISTLPSTTLGLAGFGGDGTVDFTAPLPTTTIFTKAGSGTLLLSSANSPAAYSIRVGEGSLRLNNPAATGNSPSTTFTLGPIGILDLNGYPAPAGNYMFTGGSIVNNNTSTPSVLGPAAVLDNTWDVVRLGGDGDMIAPDAMPGSFFKFGNGNLILNRPAGIDAQVRCWGGSVRLGNANALLPGSSVQLGPTGSLDLNGFSLPAGVSVSFYDGDNGKFFGGGVVNNNTATPVTFGPLLLPLEFETRFAGFGGAGTLNLNFGPLPPDVALSKVGAGLLTLPTDFSAAGVNLRAGTLQVESDNQLGSTLAFLGGTLRIAPLYLAPKSSYTFTPSISLDPAGGTVDTQRDTTLTGPFSGAGPLTKAGPASLTLANSPSPSIDLLVAAGTLRFSPSLPAAIIGSLSISPAATLDLRDTTLTTSTPYDLLRQYLHDALLTSSSPDPSNTHTLGCKDTNPGTYHIQLTLTGDANLDGLLNADDYALLDRSFARSLNNAHWTDGDFNYDGVIDASDYLLIDTTLAQTQGLTPAFLSQRESQFGDAYVSTLLASVPEPSSLLSVCGLALLPLTRRRT